MRYLLLSLLFLIPFRFLVTEGTAPVIAVISAADGVAGELWINGEPVMFLRDRATRRWSGWPLKSGANSIAFPLFSAARVQTSATPDVKIFLRERGEEKLLLEVNDSRSTGEPVGFAVRAAIAAPAQAWTRCPGELARERALSLLHALASADADRIRAEFADAPADGGDAILPPWVDAKRVAERRLVVRVVDRSEDLRVLAGERSVLVCIDPTREFASLLEITDETAGLRYVLNSLLFSADAFGALWLHPGGGDPRRLRDEGGV